MCFFIALARSPMRSRAAECMNRRECVRPKSMLSCGGGDLLQFSMKDTGFVLHFDRRVYSSLRRAPGRGRGPPKEAVALIKRIPTHTRGTPQIAAEGRLAARSCGFAPRSSRYCSRAAVFSVGEAAQLVRIVLIAPHRPASRGFSAAPSLFAGSCESARVEE